MSRSSKITALYERLSRDDDLMEERRTKPFLSGWRRDSVFPRRLTSHPLSRSSFKSVSKLSGFCKSAASMRPQSSSRWEGFTLFPSHLP